VPAEIPVINPTLVMVATVGLLLTQVPPVPGLAVIVPPTHIDAVGVLTTGSALTVRVNEVAGPEQLKLLVSLT